MNFLFKSERTFYKLASCCITRRIKEAVESLIGMQQKAYVDTNNIGSCILNILNLMDNANKKKLSGLILLVDFQKAFDSLSHTYIYNSMKLFGFGDSILNWIKQFFQGRDAVVMMRGNLTDRIYLKRRVLQGDIVSPYVFILVVEILLIKITSTKNIKGIIFAKREIRSETFTDDMSLCMIRDPKYLRAAVRYLDAFSKISGLKCNIGKTKVIPIGNYDMTNIRPEIRFQWTDSFTLLGFYIDNKLSKLRNNFDKIDEKCVI